MRADLKPGIRAANFIHAAGESGPVPEHTHAVALTCPDEASLRQLWEKLKANGVRHRAILECDGENAGQLMAIGVTPAPRKELKRFFSALSLVT